MTTWARFRHQDGNIGFGELRDGALTEHAGDPGASRATHTVRAPGTFTLLSPCVPTKIIALWNNFHALAAKLHKAAPAHAMYLIKPGSSVIGPDAPIRRPSAYRGKIAYEGELGIVIGRTCKDVPVAEAAGYILGYTCVNDVTAAEVLGESADFVQWCRSKGFDTFGCLGPVISSDLAWRSAHVITRVDGVERQNYPLADMILGPHELVSQISFDMTLLAGDVIACGTSIGVGSIKDGSTVEVAIEGIGTLANRLE